MLSSVMATLWPRRFLTKAPATVSCFHSRGQPRPPTPRITAATRLTAISSSKCRSSRPSYRSRHTDGTPFGFNQVGKSGDGVAVVSLRADPGASRVGHHQGAVRWKETVMSQLQTRAPAPPAERTATRANRLAVWALVLAVLTLGGIGSLLGIVLGAKARRELRDTGERGAGLALAAIVVGVLTLIVAIAYWVVIAQHFGGSSGSGSGSG